MSVSSNSTSSVLIVCPHCNAEARIDKSRLPVQRVTVTCHACKNKFDFNPNQETPAPKHSDSNSKPLNVEFQWEKPLQPPPQKNAPSPPKKVGPEAKKPFFKTKIGIVVISVVALISVFAVMVFAKAISIYKNEKEIYSLLNKNYTSLSVTKEERVAMRMLSILTDALENRDSSKLRMISATHKNKSIKDIRIELDKLNTNNVNNFKLANVTIFQTTPTIIGEFTYSAEQDNPDPNGIGKITIISTLNYQVGQINGKATLIVAPSGKNSSYSLGKVTEGQKRFGVDDIKKLN